MDYPRVPKWRRVAWRLFFGSAAGVAVFVLASAVRQWRREAALREARPAPDEFVQVDGRAVHYRLHGAGTVTFVLEAGLGDTSGSWSPIEPELAKIGRVFTYDRAGLGWSDPSDAQRTAVQLAEELHRTLEAAKVPRPFILVGHSLGGLTQMRLAMRHPEGVAGLLLVEPSHPQQLERLPPPRVTLFLVGQLARAAPLGLPQWLMSSADPVAVRTQHVLTAGEELRALFARDFGEGAVAVSLGNLPVQVLTAGDFTRMPGEGDKAKRASWEVWRGLHAELVAASTHPVSRQTVVAGATHYVHRSHPKVVIEAARELANAVEAEAGVARP